VKRCMTRGKKTARRKENRLIKNMPDIRRRITEELIAQVQKAERQFYFGG